MKDINQYITEKFKITSNNVRKYEYYPKNRDDLMEAIEEVCKKDKNDPINLNVIDTSEITDMSFIFGNQSIMNSINKRNIDVSDWDVSSVTDIHNCFQGLVNFDCDLSKWDVSNCKWFNAMFISCNNFTGKGLNKWNMKSAIDINYMFMDCQKLNVNGDLSKWNLQNCIHYKYVFSGTCYFDNMKRPKINGKIIK